MVDPKVLKNLVPLHNLAEGNLRRLAKKLVLEELPQGSVICREGDTDNDAIYLLEGGVELVSHSSTLTRVVQGGTEEASYPLAQARPREFTATTMTKAVIIRIDARKLDRVIILDELTTTITTMEGKTRKDANVDTEWLEQMLNNPAFHNLPTETVVAAVLKMQSQTVKSGDVVFKQGDPGDYYYVVREGRFTVSRKDSQGKVRILERLGRGSVFGEAALISGESRDVSIVAMTDGTLMRLARRDFAELLKKPLLAFVQSKEAKRMVKEGAQLVDVRTPSEYSKGALRDSINIPVSRLRQHFDALERERPYILCCRTGVQSEVAAFALRQRGFEVYVLQGGLKAIGKG